MNKMIGTSMAMFLALGLSVGTALAGGSSTTGQGIMVNLNSAGALAIHEIDTYQYNEAVAGTYFSNAWDGVVPVGVAGTFHSTSVMVTMTGLSTAPVVQSACVPPAPAAPAAPGQLASMLDGPGQSDVVGKNRCNFLDGVALVGLSYTQTATAPASCQYVSKVVPTKVKGVVVVGSYDVTTTTVSGSYVYTYNYVIAPDGDPAVMAPDFVNHVVSAWDFVDASGGGLAHVAVGADIASESMLKKAGTTVPKASFSLMEDDGITSRVQNLYVAVMDSTGALVPGAENYPASTVQTNAPGAMPGDVGALDFLYTQNAGTNGNTALLKDGDARTILNTDSFAGNDNGGANGQALAMAHADQSNFDLDVGDYSVLLTGTVKGNNATATSIGFSVTKLISIVSPGCHTTP